MNLWHLIGMVNTEMHEVHTTQYYFYPEVSASVK